MPPVLRQPVLWWVLGPSVVVLVVVAVILATRWGAILASQPAYLTTLVIVGVLGLLGAAHARWSVRVSARPLRGRAWVVTRRVLAAVGTLVLVVVLVLLRPLPATPNAVAAMAGTSTVAVIDSSSRIELVPRVRRARTGLVFFPGALVDPRAYVPLLERIAADGYTVDIVKPPFGIAFLAAGAPTGIIASHPSITRWVVGGHSLGGVAASSYAGAEHHGVDGLVLWASYPNGSLAGNTSLLVTSVSASRDGLATPAKIEATKGRLPPDTRFVVVEGAVHSDFGDYGSQRGDGTATIPKLEAQRQIEQATVDLLLRVDRPPA